MSPKVLFLDVRLNTPSIISFEFFVPFVFVTVCSFNFGETYIVCNLYRIENRFNYILKYHVQIR